MSIWFRRARMCHNLVTTTIDRIFGHVSLNYLEYHTDQFAGECKQY